MPHSMGAWYTQSHDLLSSEKISLFNGPESDACSKGQRPFNCWLTIWSASVFPSGFPKIGSYFATITISAICVDSRQRLLAAAKKETARRWLCERFDPSEMDLELSQEREDDDVAEGLDERLLKQRAVSSIGDVVSTVSSLRGAHANLACDVTMPAAHEATVGARVAFGYPKERPSRSDCFDEDVRRQCRRVINEIYRCFEKSAGPVVYIISAGDPEFVKIGFTTNFEQRLRSLRTASHAEPTIHLLLQVGGLLNATFMLALHPLATIANGFG